MQLFCLNWWKTVTCQNKLSFDLSWWSKTIWKIVLFNDQRFGLTRCSFVLHVVYPFTFVLTYFQEIGLLNKPQHCPTHWMLFSKSFELLHEQFRWTYHYECLRIMWGEVWESDNWLNFALQNLFFTWCVCVNIWEQIVACVCISFSSIIKY